MSFLRRSPVAAFTLIAIAFRNIWANLVTWLDLVFAFLHAGADGYAISFAGQFLKHGVIDREFLFVITQTLVGIRHQQRDLITLGRRWKCSKKFASSLDDRLILAISGISLNQHDVQVRTKL